MRKKLWTVNVEYDVHVVAETEEEAVRIAERVIPEGDVEPSLSSALLSTSVADGWVGCLVYGDKKERDIEWWLDQQKG